MSATAAAWLQAFAGLATFGAACFAAYYTKTAPTRAAELSEMLRKRNDDAGLIKREKRWVLLIMMQERGRISSDDAQKAVNSIPVVFAGDDKVMAAYRRLSGQHGPYTPERLRLYLALTTEVARSAGFSDVITVSDVDVGYYLYTESPPDKSTENFTTIMEQQDKLRQILTRIADAAESWGGKSPLQ